MEKGASVSSGTLSSMIEMESPSEEQLAKDRINNGQCPNRKQTICENFTLFHDPNFFYMLIKTLYSERTFVRLRPSSKPSFLFFDSANVSLVFE